MLDNGQVTIGDDAPNGIDADPADGVK